MKNLEIENLEWNMKNWQFDSAIQSLKLLSNKDFSLLPKYCSLLADTGKLDEIKNLIDKIRTNPYLRDYLDKPEFAIIRELEAFDRKITDDFLKEPSYVIKLHHFATNNKVFDVFNMLTRYRDKNISSNYSYHDNMILNYAINVLIKHNYFDDVSLIRHLIIHIANAKGMNLQSKRCMVTKIVNYIVNNKNICTDIFDLKHTYSVNLRLIPLIHGLAQKEVGANTLINSVYSAMKQVNNLELEYKDKKPKIAICISGMFKSDITNLESIKDSLVNHLDADVFVHTWDKQCDWAGSVREYNFWQRVFNINNASVPPALLDLAFLKKNFPNIYNSLLSNSFSNLDINKLKKSIHVDELMVENEECFKKQYNIGESYKTRGHFNQIKMFYGMYKCFELVTTKELAENFKYDYIIRIRPDSIIESTTLNLDNISELEEQLIAIHGGSGWGFTDGLFYTKRNTYQTVVNIYKEMLLAEQISPFKEFEGWDAHKLLALWLLKNDITPVSTQVSYALLGVSKTFKVPNLKQSLYKDCNEESYKKYPYETKWLMDFLEDKCRED